MERMGVASFNPKGGESEMSRFARKGVPRFVPTRGADMVNSSVALTVEDDEWVRGLALAMDEPLSDVLEGLVWRGLRARFGDDWRKSPPVLAYQRELRRLLDDDGPEPVVVAAPVAAKAPKARKPKRPKLRAVK